MFDHLFENRNTTVTNLLKLGDCLGRSLRENIELFSIDSENQKVAYLSQSGRVISAQYDCKEDLSITEISIQNADIFSDNEVFDSFVDGKVTGFVGDLNEDRFEAADNSFNEILSLWENRLKFENVKKKLDEKAVVFGESQQIVDTEEFQRFLEIMPQVTDFLQENREAIQKVQEVENAIKLSNSVSKAFNFPRLSYDALEESGSYRVAKGISKTVYDLICKQELVKKELLESKKSFEDVWATNPKIRGLASLIFEDSNEVVLESLVEAVVDVPYLALTTKRQLLESLTNAFSLTDHTSIATKELKVFASRLFEMKKPLKQVILSLLNEKYGINVQNLKETATFTGLANTQVVIFEALTRLAPKGSIVRSTLGEISSLLKSKNGVEVIDVNDVLQECFETCGYDKFCTDFTLVESLSFEDILTSEVSVADLIEKTKEKLLLSKTKKNSKDSMDKEAGDENLSPEQKQQKKKNQKDEDDPTNISDMEDDSVRAAEAAAPFSKPAPFSAEGGSSDGEGDDDEGGDDEKDSKEESSDLSARLGDPDDGDMDDPKTKKKKKKKVKEEAEPSEAPAEQPEAPQPQGDEPEAQEKVNPLSKEEFLDSLKDMDELLQGMTSETEDDEVDEAEDDEQEA